MSWIKVKRYQVIFRNRPAVGGDRRNDFAPEIKLDLESSPGFGKTDVTLRFRRAGGRLSDGGVGHFVEDRIEIFIGPEEYMPILDLLRNEAPVFCLCGFDGGIVVPDFRLATGMEGVGEGEQPGS